ncbi:MAG: PQQ-dependent sugar dehydrogenase [Methylococcaceae bacterium]|nr:PQQ-dependent sugar dehydrogenase [Methylococcaceae bacterium]
MKFIGSLLLLSCFAASAWADQAWLAKIKLPAGFHITLYTEHTPNARSLALGEDGTVYVGTLAEGKVYALRDEDHDGKADKVLTLASGLNAPNGVAFLKGDLYIAEIHRIVKLKDISSHLSNPPKPEVVYEGYPTERHHGWKYLRVGPDGKLYVPVGAPCNICLSEKEIYASLTRLDPDGRNLEIYARGIRNSVGLDWHPQTGELFFTDNGRDLLGDDAPPEELNAAPKAGMHFGYPYCHGGDISDPEFGPRQACSRFTPPAWKFPAHTAPPGLRLYRGTQFPADYRNQLFVAQHGSWNRSVPQGYRLMLVRFKEGKPIADEIFAQGWLQPNGEVLGRPVDILEMADGSILVSDDLKGAIYRIAYQP